jgi:uncharacterized protein YkwD
MNQQKIQTLKNFKIKLHQLDRCLRQINHLPLPRGGWEGSYLYRLKSKLVLHAREYIHAIENGYNWPIVGVIAGLISFLTMANGISHADMLLTPPTPSAAQIVTVEGRVKFRRGEQNQPRPATTKDKLSNRNEALIVPGVSTGKKPLSTMAFIFGEKQYANLLIQAGPHPNQTQYIFPCQVRGGKVSIGWGLDGECSNEGMLLLPSLMKGQLISAKPTMLLASNNLQIAQANQVQEKDYTIEGNKGDQLEINATSRDFDTYLTLLDSEGNVIIQNDNVDSKNRNSRIITSLPYDGVYAAVIKNLNRKGGRYTITWKIKSRDSVNTLYGYLLDFGAPADDYLIVKPASRLATYTQVGDANPGIQVVAISGNVLIASPEDAQGFVLEEGKKYTYTKKQGKKEDKIEFIDLKSILNTPEFQTFINPKNWASRYLSKPVKNAIEDQLRKYAAVLAGGTSPTQPSQQTCNISSNVSADIRQLFQLVNKYRGDNSIPCLQFDERLARAAQVYADNLSSRKASVEEFLQSDHKAIYPDRTTTICDRFFNEGYYTEPFGEIASLATSPSEAVQLWLNDPRHSEALLDRNGTYTHAGFGYARSDSGLGYYVQTLGQSVNITREDMASHCAR